MALEDGPHEAWEAEADDMVGPPSRVHLTHAVLGEQYGHVWPSPAGAHEQAKNLRAYLAGMGWTIEVVEA